VTQEAYGRRHCMRHGQPDFTHVPGAQKVCDGWEKNKNIKGKTSSWILKTLLLNFELTDNHPSVNALLNVFAPILRAPPSIAPQYQKKKKKRNQTTKGERGLGE
jgi:hypothetical protein